MFNKEYFASLLQTKYCGRELLYYDTLPSTNDTAKALAAEGCKEGLTVIADAQSAGKGTKERSFYSPKGAGLYMSLILRPKVKITDALYITFAAAVSVREAIADICGLECRIKYVNDIIYDGKKICGILTESAFARGDTAEYICVGIGVNIKKTAFPKELASRAALLENYTEKPVSAEALAADILAKLECFAENFSAEKIKEEYVKHLIDPPDVL